MAAFVKRHPLLIVTALGALLRLSTLGVESLWYDETFTAWLSGLPLNRLISATLDDVHPPTWYLIEWMMVGLLGHSEIALRLVSALAGIVLIPAIYLLALEFDFGRRRALYASILCAAAPFFTYYSQEARAYSLIYLLTTLATMALLRRRWVWFVLAAAGAMYLHNLTGLYLAALFWLALYRYHADRRQLLAAVLAFGVVGLLWLPWFMGGMLPQTHAVMQGFWVRRPTAGSPFFILVSYFFSGKAMIFVWVTTPLLAIGLARGLARVGVKRWALMGLLLLPLALNVILSVLVTPILVERVIGSSAVALVLLLAWGVFPETWPRFNRLTWPVYAWIGAFLAVVIAVYATMYGTARIGRYPWNYGLSHTLAEIQPDDGLFHGNLATYIILRYYLPHDQWVWRQANDLSQSLTDQTKWAMDMNQAGFEEVACRHRRWWLFFYENPTTSERERAEVSRLVTTYHGRLEDTILKTILVNARVYRLDNPCQNVARRGY